MAEVAFGLVRFHHTALCMGLGVARQKKGPFRDAKEAFKSRRTEPYFD
jgi:hypothetical protein